MQKLLLLLLVIGVSLPVASVRAIVPNDTLFYEQWYLTQVSAPSAWDIETGSDNVVVAVIDTGIDLTHEDLVAQIFTNLHEVPGDGIDNDNNGLIDDIHGWDFYDGDNNANPVPNGEDYGVHHGTVVAGMIGASGDNSVGIAGLNWDVSILPIRVLNSDGDGDIHDIVKGINYAVSMGADVINLSLVGDTDPGFLEESLQNAFNKNIVVVAAMGNLDDGGVNLDATPLYPACSNGMGHDDVVIGVVSTDEKDSKSTFSNYGSDCADIAAPGQSIFSTQVTNGDAKYTDGWQGTSLSAPIVSGTAALMKAMYPNVTPTEVKLAMQLSVDPIVGVAPSGVVGALGSGRLNITRALSMLPQLVKDKSGETLEPIMPVSDSSTTTLYGSNLLVVGAGAGDKPLVTVFNGESVHSWYAYAESFRGGVKVASGQLDNKAGNEIVTGAGVGGGPHIRVFDEQGNVKSQFFAFDEYYRGGVDIAVGDTDNDGIDEIIVVPGQGREQVARAFNMQGELIFELDVIDNHHELNVSAGDVDGDHRDDILISEREGGLPVIHIYNLATELKSELSVYTANMNRGVESTVVNNNGVPQIVSGTNSGAGPQVRQFNRIGAFVGQFFAFNENDRHGVDVSSWKIDGTDYIVTSGIEDGVPVLKVFDVSSNVISASLPLIGYTERVNI